MFFYLGDTAWELFHRLNREEAVRYLDARAAQGFTVIQAVALAELDGITVPNAYGDLPLLDRDPASPPSHPAPAPTINRSTTIGITSNTSSIRPIGAAFTSRFFPPGAAG